MSKQNSIFVGIVERLNDLAIKEEFSIGRLQEARARDKSRAFKKIFTGHSIFDRYAFHTGGRSEIQFNIGIEDHGNEKWFRYGLAFSLKGGISLQDPIGTFAPRIDVFNALVRETRSKWGGTLLWKHGDVFEAPRPLHEIPNDWVVRGTFIFLGKYTTKKISEIDDSFLLEVLSYLDTLMPIYNYVETGIGKLPRQIEKRISKICWNSNSWQKPSGRAGKSADKSSHEHQHGYGHEEWLFDFDKTIKGYHYAFLQPIGKHREKYTGNIFDIELYSVNSSERRSFWVAELKHVEVIDKETENRAIAEYVSKGWLDEMYDDLDAVDADVEGFKKWLKRDGIFNIRFRPQDVFWSDVEPVPFAEGERISHTRYTLLHRDALRDRGAPIDDVISGVDQKDIQNTKKQVRRQKIVECSQLHNEIQNSLLKYFRKKFPDDLTKLEGNTGCRTKVDLFRTAKDGTRYFYEVKTYPSAKACIREALGQLFEYAFYPDRVMADQLVIVSQAPLGDRERAYIRCLQRKLPFPVGYIQFDHANSNILEQL